ncbi:unnamed protein product [Vitrella brassicaformis CCMP3155]|uniref:ABC transporter domain-containing protein n=1 Tax=Vitrella brassicaformis (strain CCMP3155) TaxID=1169540 RepID=A0A0G4GVL4_VITBC|nr:unnamed protein product [Vitrella brassicaformis CCMP3155]|mmetsp:Transcript_5704/g.13601  ORF Transcript_5704/g.13601 Transcript_5704/m.13601 type:complete len:776 (-) Transcript_5704:57-2384(-)|eukprot:CEM34861.1 unnamed protein product [Vitrella brassicaformis CCMP3155]
MSDSAAPEIAIDPSVAEKEPLLPVFTPTHGGYGGGSKAPGLTIEFRRLSYSILPAKKGAQPHRILKEISGMARPGCLMAILGPSGSGKTTLLHSLAGQLAYVKGATLSGEVIVGGTPLAKSTHRQAFVQQKDVFYGQLTVHETVLMAARLRLPSKHSTNDKEAFVGELLSQLGLAKCANTLVGDDKRRGVSGGEKKRLSLGCELVGTPAVIFADEPTTGLDAFQAERVMASLRSLAHDQGKTVIVSIHQPRSSIWTMFDDVIVLSEGEQVYCGLASDMVGHFSRLGHQCPPNYNLAEFCVDLASIDFTSTEAEESSRARVQQLVTACRDSNPIHQEAIKSGTLFSAPSAFNIRPSVITAPLAPLWEQFALLFMRSWRQVSRDKFTNQSRFGSALFSAIVFGSIFFRIQNFQSHIQDRLGLLQVAAINGAMSSLIKTITVFVREREVVTREREAKLYRVTPYFIAKLAAELPIGAFFPCFFGAVMYPLAGLNPSFMRFLFFIATITLESFVASAFGLCISAFCPSYEAAMAIAPAVMVIFIVFGGYYINPDNIPWVFRWLDNISLIRWGFEALCINEFTGLKFECDYADQPGCLRTGEEVLARLSFDQTTVASCCISLLLLLLAYYLITYVVLVSSNLRLQKIEPPNHGSPKGGSPTHTQTTHTPPPLYTDSATGSSGSPTARSNLSGAAVQQHNQQHSQLPQSGHQAANEGPRAAEGETGVGGGDSTAARTVTKETDVGSGGDEVPVSVLDGEKDTHKGGAADMAGGEGPTKVRG